MDKGNSKLATTIEEQIELLASRGMTFGNVEKSKENLLDIGYYRLGFYWFPFEVSFPRIAILMNPPENGFLPDSPTSPVDISP